MMIKIKIEGTTPILMNRFTEENEIAVSGGIALRGDKGTPRERATRKRYADASRNLFIPDSNIFVCMVAACAERLKERTCAASADLSHSILSWKPLQPHNYCLGVRRSDRSAKRLDQRSMQ
jgi:hypothetical protein